MILFSWPSYTNSVHRLQLLSGSKSTHDGLYLAGIAEVIGLIANHDLVYRPAVFTAVDLEVCVLAVEEDVVEAFRKALAYRLVGHSRYIQCWNVTGL